MIEGGRERNGGGGVQQGRRKMEGKEQRDAEVCVWGIAQVLGGKEVIATFLFERKPRKQGKSETLFVQEGKVLRNFFFGRS